MNPQAADTVESLLDQLQHSDRAVVRRAVDALVVMAAQEPLLAELLEQRLRDDRSRWKWPIAYTLGRVVDASEVCLGVLAEGLGSDDQDVRWATQRLLTELGARQRTVYEALVEFVRSGVPNQRRMAVYCLRDIGLEDSQHARPIVAACNDPDPRVRVAAVTSLAKSHGSVARSAQIFSELANADPDERVRNAARFALSKISESR